MKKFFFSMLVCVVTTTSNAQKMSYKVGVMTGLPFSVQKTNVNAGSTLLEASRTLSDKFSATAHSGYVRMTRDNVTMSQVPVLLGAKYSINSQLYFGASAGVTIPTNGENSKAEFGYSPYVGVQKGKISVDARYYVSGLKFPVSTLGLVFSYKL